MHYDKIKQTNILWLALVLVLSFSSFLRFCLPACLPYLFYFMNLGWGCLWNHSFTYILDLVQHLGRHLRAVEALHAPQHDDDVVGGVVGLAGRALVLVGVALLAVLEEGLLSSRGGGGAGVVLVRFRRGVGGLGLSVETLKPRRLRCVRHERHRAGGRALGPPSDPAAYRCRRRRHCR